MNLSRDPGRAGFNLTELLMVVVILGILAVLATPSFYRPADHPTESGVGAMAAIEPGQDSHEAGVVRATTDSAKSYTSRAPAASSGAAGQAAEPAGQ